MRSALKQKIIQRFLTEAFYSHEITISDYEYLMEKSNTRSG